MKTETITCVLGHTQEYVNLFLRKNPNIEIVSLSHSTYIMGKYPKFTLYNSIIIIYRQIDTNISYPNGK